MPEYDDSLKIKDALQLYFSRYHFADGGYHLKWFRIKLGPLFVPLPNTKGRLAAVKIHDIHHLLTEYTALWKGEMEIGAWEIASGCGKYLASWILNFGSFTIGLFCHPVYVFRAFMRGCTVRTNLYYSVKYDADLLNKTVGEMREYTGINTPSENNRSDYMKFFIWCVFSVVYVTVSLSIVFLLSKWIYHKFSF